jgi:protein disulfide-isomerase A6
MGVQGFPTLKIVRPGKKPGRPIVEDYQGDRSAKAIVDAVVEKIPNHVKRITDKSLDAWLEESGDSAKAILFSDKGVTSALLKSLAIDYLGSVSVAQIRDKEKEAVDKFGITKFPTFIILPGGSEDSIAYGGDLKKDAMSNFISESSGISPNPDPAPEEPKKSKPKKDKSEKKSKSKFSKASASQHRSEDASSKKREATSASLEDEPAASPDPKSDSAKPVEVPDVAPPLTILTAEADLHESCLNPRSKICILALLPTPTDAEEQLPHPAIQALQALSEVHHKLSKRGIFPFYAVPASNSLAQIVRDALSLKPSSEIEIIATNAKRSWVRKYGGETYGVQELSDWVDGIKMNEGKKEKLPESLIQDSKAEDVPPPEPEAVPEPEKEEEESESPRVEEPEEPIEAPEVVTEGPIVIEETKEAEAEKPKEEDLRDEL